MSKHFFDFVNRMGYWIIYGIFLVIWMIIFTLPIYGWIEIWGWGPEISNPLAGGWMVMFFLCFTIWITLALGRVKIDQFMLMPCSLADAKIIMIDCLPPLHTDGQSKSSIGSSTIDKDREFGEDTDCEPLCPIDENECPEKQKKMGGWRLDHFIIWIQQSLLRSAPVVPVVSNGMPKSKSYCKRVGTDYLEEVRSFDFMCLRYVWSEDNRKVIICIPTHQLE